MVYCTDSQFVCLRVVFSSVALPFCFIVVVWPQLPFQVFLCEL